MNNQKVAKELRKIAVSLIVAENMYLSQVIPVPDPVTPKIPERRQQQLGPSGLQKKIKVKKLIDVAQ